MPTKKGHKVACLYTSVKEQKQVVKKNAKSDFDRSNRLKNKENREKSYSMRKWRTPLSPVLTKTDLYSTGKCIALGTYRRCYKKL